MQRLRWSAGSPLLVATIPSVSSQASPCPKEANRALLNDSSCWTIIGTESVEFSFSTSLVWTREPVTPVPLISTLEVNLGAGGCRRERSHCGCGVGAGEGEQQALGHPLPLSPS